MKFGVPRNLSVKKAVNVLIPISLLGLSNILVILEISTKSEVIAFGYIDAENKIKICANISGIIDSVFIQEGQEVKIGDKLLTIDSRKIQRELFSLYTEYQNLQDELIELNKAANLLAQNYMFESYGGNVSLQQLKIHLDEATEKYSIAETLFVKGMISRCERDDKKRNYLAALAIYDTYQHSIEMQKRKYEKLITQKKREIELIKSKIADTEEAIDKSVVYAPISGLCHLPTALFAGKKTDEGDVLFELYNLSAIYFSCRVREEDVFKIKQGSECKIYLNACPFPKYPLLDGEVKEIGEIVESNEGGRTVEIKISIKNCRGVPITKLYLSGRVKIASIHEDNLIKKLLKGLSKT